MNKELLDKIDQALQAQQDTINRQNQMIDEKDRDIQRLQRLLETLATTQTEQLQRLPSLYENLKDTISEQKNTQAQWLKHRKDYTASMSELANVSLELCKRQIRLIESMKEYRSTIVPPDELQSVTASLENELDELATSQSKIINSQQSLKRQQEHLQKLLQTSK